MRISLKLMLTLPLYTYQQIPSCRENKIMFRDTSESTSLLPKTTTSSPGTTGTVAQVDLEDITQKFYLTQERLEALIEIFKLHKPSFADQLNDDLQQIQSRTVENLKDLDALKNNILLITKILNTTYKIKYLDRSSTDWFEAPTNVLHRIVLVIFGLICLLYAGTSLWDRFVPSAKPDFSNPSYAENYLTATGAIPSSDGKNVVNVLFSDYWTVTNFTQACEQLKSFDPNECESDLGDKCKQLYYDFIRYMRNTCLLPDPAITKSLYLTGIMMVGLYLTIAACQGIFMLRRRLRTPSFEHLKTEYQLALVDQCNKQLANSEKLDQILKHFKESIIRISYDIKNDYRELNNLYDRAHDRSFSPAVRAAKEQSYDRRSYLWLLPRDVIAEILSTMRNADLANANAYRREMDRDSVIETKSTMFRLFPAINTNEVQHIPDPIRTREFNFRRA